MTGRIGIRGPFASASFRCDRRLQASEAANVRRKCKEVTGAKGVALVGTVGLDRNGGRCRLLQYLLRQT